CSIMVSSESFQSSICPKVRKNLVVNFVCVKHPKFVSYVGSTVPESSPTAIDIKDYFNLPEFKDKTPTEIDQMIPQLYEQIGEGEVLNNITRTEPICDTQVLELKCGSGELMHIVSAFYGKPEANKKYGNCLSIDRVATNFPCFDRDALSKIKDVCEYTEICNISPNKLLSSGRSCNGITQNLIVDFVCVGLENVEAQDMILHPNKVNENDPIMSQNNNLEDYIVGKNDKDKLRATEEYYTDLTGDLIMGTKNKPLCDGQKLTIQCKPADKIHIVGAFYGKPKSNTQYGSCQKIDAVKGSFPCSKVNIMAVVKEQCEERNSCVLVVDDENLAVASCIGIKKHLIVSAVCLDLSDQISVLGINVDDTSEYANKKEVPDVNDKSLSAPDNFYESITSSKPKSYTISPPVCDGQKLKIKCTGENNLIHVISAFYGKPKADTKYGYCRKRDFMESQFPCYSSSILTVLSNKCETRKSCSIKVGNSLANNPDCQLIEKHLIVKFVCVYHKPEEPVSTLPPVLTTKPLITSSPKPISSTTANKISTTIQPIGGTKPKNIDYVPHPQFPPGWISQPTIISIQLMPYRIATYPQINIKECLSCCYLNPECSSFIYQNSASSCHHFNQSVKVPENNAPGILKDLYSEYRPRTSLPLPIKDDTIQMNNNITTKYNSSFLTHPLDWQWNQKFVHLPQHIKPIQTLPISNSHDCQMKCLDTVRCLSIMFEPQQSACSMYPMNSLYTPNMLNQVQSNQGGYPLMEMYPPLPPNGGPNQLNWRSFQNMAAPCPNNSEEQSFESCKHDCTMDDNCRGFSYDFKRGFCYPTHYSTLDVPKHTKYHRTSNLYEKFGKANSGY
ncbi:hypothetical protein SNEBB_011169, partial [Seison nebaliae]